MVVATGTAGGRGKAVASPDPFRPFLEIMVDGLGEAAAVGHQLVRGGAVPGLQRVLEADLGQAEALGRRLANVRPSSLAWQGSASTHVAVSRPRQQHFSAVWVMKHSNGACRRVALKG